MPWVVEAGKFASVFAVVVPLLVVLVVVLLLAVVVLVVSIADSEPVLLNPRRLSKENILLFVARRKTWKRKPMSNYLTTSFRFSLGLVFSKSFPSLSFVFENNPQCPRKSPWMRTITGS